MIGRVYGIAGRMFRSTKPVRDRHYLQFLRRFPCVGCSTERRQREAMHTGPRGLGQKASDDDALPGCHQCHLELHAIGPALFQLRHKIEFSDLIEMFQSLYRNEFPHRKPPESETVNEPAERGAA
jgi:hypothetical protein